MKLITAKRVLIAILILIAIGLLALTNMKPPDVSFDEIDISLLPDGIFEASYVLGPVKAIVEVEVSFGAITDISILEHRTGQGQKAEALLQSIISEQRLSVDIVSGATWSSRAILKAVESALLKAKDAR